METLSQLRHMVGLDGIVCLAVVVISLAAAGLLTPLARRLAFHHGATDLPGGRRVHTRITPRLGGLAVLCALVLGTIVGLNVWPGAGMEQLTALSVVLPIILIGAMVCLFGAVDDLAPVTPFAKIVGLSLAGVLLALSGISIDFVTLPGIGRIEFGIWAMPATILWVLACTNAINLIDGVDGSGPGVVTISAFAMMLLSLGLGDFTTGLLFAATCGASCGFLIHNREPASIFLGDSGSLLLGFMLAATSAAGCTKSATAVSLTGALIAMAVPFLDATQSFVRRFRASLRHGSHPHLLEALKATAIADQGHIHHRLLVQGLSHREVAMILCLVTTVTSLSTLLLLPTGQVSRTAMIAVLVAGICVLTRLGKTRSRARTDAVDETVDEAVLHPPPPEGGPQGMGTPRRTMQAAETTANRR